MKPYCLFSLWMLVFTASAIAPDKKPKEQQKAEKELTACLNSILKVSNTIHWAYKDDNMTIDSGFEIDNSGTLSVTVRYYHPDSGYYRVRLAAPVACLARVDEDIYYVFTTMPHAVSLYETSGWNSEQLKLVKKADVFHIGCPRKYSLYRKFMVDKMQILLDNVKKYYKQST